MVLLSLLRIKKYEQFWYPKVLGLSFPLIQPLPFFLDFSLDFTTNSFSLLTSACTCTYR
jgi:hypothetical protein